ncbi:hypothetical protein Tco_1048908 [Tanacetum coccineum]
MDRSSYLEGSMAGLILKSPEGAEFTYALLFEFDASNNEAEYEALIFCRRPPAKGVGLRMADSHTSNYPEDDFTPLETIRRPYSVIRKRILFELEGKTFKPERRVIINIFLIMTAKDSIATQTCKLSKEEFNDFLTIYPIPSEYRVILPKSNLTIFDAPPGYVGLYTHSFSIENLRLSLTEFFYEVLEYFQRLDRYLTSVRVFPDPILFLAGLKSSWEHGQQRPAILVGEMAFRNFIYTKDDEDLAFLPKEPSPGFGIGSPSVSVNMEPLKANEEPETQLIEVTSDSGGSPKPELFVIHPGSVAARIKDRKCKTRGWSSRPPVKRKLASGSSTSRATRAKTSSSKDDAPFLTVFYDDEGFPDVLELKDATAYHLKIFAITPPASKNHMDNHMDLELLDLHDRCYARQAVVDNFVNRRSCELLHVIEKLRGECGVMRSRERAREEECEGLQVKCEAAMTEFEKNPAVVALWEKIFVLSDEVKEHKLNLDRMMLESQKLEAVEVSLQKEVEELKQDRREVVSKVVPYAVMELVYSDDMGSLVGKLVSSAIMYGRCRAFEQVVDMKEPFDLSKVKGYHSSHKKDHTQANNDLATTTFPWLDEFVADPSTHIEALLSKKPSRNQIPFPFSQRATPSSVLVSNPMSPPADAFVVKPQFS